MRYQTSDLRIPRSDALPLSHRDSTVSEVYHEVHMTRVLYTASNVESVMFVDRNRRDGKFLSSVKKKRKMFFRFFTSVGHGKKILSPHEESNHRPSDMYMLSHVFNGIVHVLK